MAHFVAPLRSCDRGRERERKTVRVQERDTAELADMSRDDMDAANALFELARGDGTVHKQGRSEDTHSNGVHSFRLTVLHLLLGRVQNCTVPQYSATARVNKSP